MHMSVVTSFKTIFLGKRCPYSKLFGKNIFGYRAIKISKSYDFFRKMAVIGRLSFSYISTVKTLEV